MKNILSLTFFFLIVSAAFSQNNFPGASGNSSKNPSPMNGNASLGSSYSNTACGLNYVYDSAHVETRYYGATMTFKGCGLPCSWTITGLPSCYVVDKAFVYALVSYVEPSAPASSVTITNPAASTSTYAAPSPIGTDGGKCWGETGSAVYRWDVTAAISGNGNYGFNFSGFTTVQGPYFNTPADQVDGATLIIIYKDPNASYQGTMNLWDGAVEESGPASTMTMTGLNVCAAPIAARAFTISSDHQPNVGPTHSVTLNGVAMNFPNIFYDEDEAPVTLTAGQTTSAFGMDGSGGGDCYLWGVTGLYYQDNCVVCTPSAVSLTVTPTNSTCNAPNGSAVASASGTNPPFTYLWSPGGQTTTSISNLVAGNYTCTVTNASGCSSVQSFTVATSVGPNVTFTTTPSICTASNGSATLTASGGTAPYTYAWGITPANTTVTATGLASGTYSVLVGDASGCGSTYTVTVSLVTNTFVVTPAHANAKCFGSSNGSASATPSGGATPYTYAWNTTPIQTTSSISGIAAGNYSVIIADADGCTETASFTITQPTALTTTASVVNNAKCNLSSDGSAITNASGGTSPYNYVWTPTGQNTQTASGLPAGTYSAIVTDANGCTATSPATITQPIAISLSSTSVKASCGISDGSASVSASGGTGAYTYLWLTSPVQVTQTISNLAAGPYSVLVTDANGCTNQMSITVPASGAPTANFTDTPDTVNLTDATVYFTDLSVNASTWLWNFGDPNDPAAGSAENPTHTYSDTGVYCITLIIADPGGVCKDTAVHCIKVEAPYTFYIPNCFTPNGDGFNEMFSGKGIYIKTFHMLVFDRWGNKIFESNDIEKGWDGKVQGANNGKLVQEDVYVWKVNITDANNKKHNYIGRVTMVK